MNLIFRKKTDQEFLEQIRRGNKNVLIRLFNLHFWTIRKFVSENGGNREDARRLLKESLARLWADASNEDFILNGTIKSYLSEKVKALWLQQHGEVEIRNFIEERLRPKFTSGRKLALAGSAFLLILLACWWYYDSQPITTIREKTRLFIPGKDSSQVSVKVSPGKSKTKKLRNDSDNGESGSSSEDSTEVSVNDSLNLPNEILAENDTVKQIQPVKANPASEEFIIRKDELLFTKIIQVVEKNRGTKEAASESSLAQETAQKLNPEAGLPEEEDKSIKSIVVEFWKSPVKYKGFKMGKNKIIFYGIEEPDWVKLYSLDGTIYLEYGREYYRLESSYDFRNFSPINDVSVTSLLKK